MNLNDLQTFSVVAERGSISAAAQRLGVPKSTVSRRVRRLEDALGHDLLRRSARAVSLTDHGRVLHQRSTASLQELHAAVDAIVHADTEPQGTLRLTTVPGFGYSHRFLDSMHRYGLRYPKITVELELTERLVNLVDEGFDVAIRLHTGGIPAGANLMSRTLLRFGRAIYASPEYLDEMGTPQTFGDLADHRIAAHSVIDAGAVLWKHHGKSLQKPRALPKPKWLINGSGALERFALFGAGLALLPTYDADALCDQGQLVRVLPEYEQQGATASLIWPASRHLAPRVRAFIDHAIETMSALREEEIPHG